MAKTTINRTEKQQMSMILRSQLLNDFECSRDHKNSMAMKIVKSGYHVNHSITGWYSEHFKFAFEYGRKGGVRVTYLNSDGIQSAIFNHTEWSLLMHDIEDRCKSIEAKQLADIKAREKELEEIHFKYAVESAVYDILERERKRAETQHECCCKETKIM